MTTLEKYYIFIQEHTPLLKIGNITLTPEYDQYSDKVYWTMYNPMNESYSHYVLNGYCEEVLHTFSQYTSSVFFEKLKSKQKLETPRAIYLNPDDEHIFLEYAQKTTKFKYKKIKMDIHAFNIETRIDSDGMYFTISVMCLNPYDIEKQKELTYSELKDRLVEYNEWDSFFEYTEYLFNDLLNYVWENVPTLFDNTYMITQADIRYFTPTHKEIKLW